MLDITNPAREGSHSFEAIQSHRPEAAKQGLNLAQLADFVRRQWPVILAAVLVTVGLGVAYLVMAPPRYTGIR